MEADPPHLGSHSRNVRRLAIADQLCSLTFFSSLRIPYSAIWSHLLPASTSPSSNFFLTCPAFSLKPSSPAFLAVYCWACALLRECGQPVQGFTHRENQPFLSQQLLVPTRVWAWSSLHLSRCQLLWVHMCICPSVSRKHGFFTVARHVWLLQSFRLEGKVHGHCSGSVRKKSAHPGLFTPSTLCSSEWPIQSGIQSYHEENSSWNDRSIFFFWAVNLSVGKSYSIDLISCVYLSSDDTRIKLNPGLSPFLVVWLPRWGTQDSHHREIDAHWYLSYKSNFLRCLPPLERIDVQFVSPSI